MYNGIGLPTPRGSGTNGYVQRNLSFVRKIKDKINYHTEDELKKLDSTINKAPNKDILLHQRKREMELKCVEMEELMKEQGYSQEEIEEKVATFRFMLMNAEDIGDRDIPKDEHGRPTVKESHQIAEANQEKNQRVKEAFGISPFFVEGSSLDPDRKQKEAAAAAAALAEKNKQYSLIKDSSSSPSPVREKEKSRKKKKSRDESESPVRSKKKKSSKKHRRERSQSHEQKKKKKKKRKSGKDKYKHRSLSSEGKKKTRETSVSSSHSTNTSESEDSTPVTSDSGSDHSSNDSFIENRRFDKTLKKKSHLHKHVRSSKKQKEQRESSIESHSRRSRRDQCESSKRNKRKQKDSVSTSSNSSVDVSKGENSFCNRKKKQTELGNMVARSKTISECHSKSINTKHKKRKHNEISSDDEHVNFKLAKRKLVVHSPSSSSSSSETSRMREKSTKVKYHKKSASTDRNKKHVKGMSAERESRSLSYSPVAHSQSKEFNDEPCYTTEKLLKKKSSDMQKFESQSSKGNKCGKEKNKKSNKIALIKERDVEDSESDPALHYAIKQIRVSKKKKHRTSSSKYNGYHPSTSSSSTYSDSHSSRSPSVRKRHSTSSDSDALSHKTKKPRNPSEEINQSSVEIYNKHNSTSRKFTDFSSEFQNKNSASLNRKQSNDALPQPWPALVPCNEKKRGQISIKINQLSDIAKKCSPLKQDKGHSPTVTSKNDTVLENTSKNANLVIVEKNQAQSAEIPNTCLTDLPPLSTNLLRSSGEKQGSPVKSNRSLSPSKRNSHSSSSSRSRSRSHTPTRNRSRSISHSPSHNRSRSRSRSPTHSRSNSRHSSRSHSRSYSSHSRSRSRSASRSPSIPRRRGSPSFLDKRRITRSHGRSRYRHYSRSHSRSPYRSYRRRYSSSRSYSRSRSRSRSHDYNKSRHHY